MRIGCPKEIKNNENRVGLTPAGAKAFTGSGHEVFVEAGAGLGSGFSDAEYTAAGAKLLPTAKEVFDAADMVIKVKEPQKGEIAMLKKGQILFTYLHLAPDPEQTKGLLASGATCIAYETITDASGKLPLLTPMSEVAGRMAVQIGAYYLQKTNGGRGMLMGGVPGVPPAHVVVLGAGVVGLNAIKMAVGMGARVTVLDRSLPTLRYLDDIFGNRIETVWSSDAHVEEILPSVDLVIGAVLVPGAAAPKLIRRSQLAQMRPGAVIVDVSIDQGGCAETSRPTSHHDPIYVAEGVVHYCVTNMPGAVPHTATHALTNTTLSYALALADRGFTDAVAADATLRRGVNVADGEVWHAGVAAAFDLPRAS